MNFLLRDAECYGEKHSNYKNVKISSPIDIPEINSVEDAFEYLKYWKNPSDGKVLPFAVCFYMIMHSDNSLDRYSNQMFTSSEVGGNAKQLTKEQIKLASYVIDIEKIDDINTKIAVFRTFATPKNARLLFDTLNEQNERIEKGENDKIIPIPFINYISTEIMLAETKSHDIPYEKIRETEKYNYFREEYKK